jgi:hypothetical protein
VWPGPVFVQVVCEPLRGVLLLTLGTVAGATGRMDAVVAPTVWTLREAVSLVAALTVWESADDLAVREGEVGGTLQVFWCTGGAESPEGSHGRSPCMRAPTRS